VMPGKAGKEQCSDQKTYGNGASQGVGLRFYFPKARCFEATAS